MNDRKYLIIPSTEVNKIDFTKIYETSSETLLYSGDGKRTFIKWTGDDPEFVSRLKNTQGPYDHSQIKEIIKSDEWLSPKRTRKKVT